MIPQEKSAAVCRALQEAFGVSDFDDIRQLTGGLGANPVFRIVVRGSAYLLRINLRAGDVARHYACMRAAAEAGLAPRVWHTNVEDRISIMDFVDASPFPMTEAAVRIPAVLRSLHALPPFARVPDHFNTSCMFLLNKGPALDGFLQKFRSANLLPDGGNEELFARYAEVAEVYANSEADMVSSHNDLFKPDNMLFDGQRLWLVDWETAFLNDRYADLAAVANQLVANDEEERAYLQEYFGAPADEYQRAKFFLMQQIAHLFYTMGFLFLGSAGQPIDWSQPVPEFRDYQRRIWAREVNLSDKPTKIVYGKVHWEQLFRNVRLDRYQESLRIVSGR